jgi:hypothetical protein
VPQLRLIKVTPRSSAHTSFNGARGQFHAPPYPHCRVRACCGRLRIELYGGSARPVRIHTAAPGAPGRPLLPPRPRLGLSWQLPVCHLRAMLGHRIWHGRRLRNKSGLGFSRMAIAIRKSKPMSARQRVGGGVARPASGRACRLIERDLNNRYACRVHIP